MTYPVTLTLKNIPANLSLLAGMSGKAIVKAPKEESKLATTSFKVPKSAVFTDNLNRSYIWVVDPATQTVHKKAVRLDVSSKEDFAIILKGVKEDEWVITAGTGFISEGQKVKISAEQARP
jgi:membrane fusion protein, multidrug efflux system